MTATERLRELLDEHGVEYRWDNGTATWYVDGVMYNAWGYDNERLTISVCHLTPEQAIAATLGAGQATDEWGDGFRAGCDAANKASEESVEHYKAENAKLRELVARVDRARRDLCDAYPDAELLNCEQCPAWSACRGDLMDRMRELGVEVDG